MANAKMLNNSTKILSILDDIRDNQELPCFKSKTRSAMLGGPKSPRIFQTTVGKNEK